jgi:hypothetical protein
MVNIVKIGIIFGVIVVLLILFLFIIYKPVDDKKYLLKEIDVCPSVECGILKQNKIFECIIKGTNTIVDNKYCDLKNVSVTRECKGNVCKEDTNCVDNICVTQQPIPQPVTESCDGVTCDSGFSCNSKTGKCSVLDPKGNCNDKNCDENWWCDPIDGSCIQNTESISICQSNCGETEYCLSATGKCFKGEGKTCGVCPEGEYCDTQSGSCGKCASRLCPLNRYCVPLTGKCAGLCDNIICKEEEECDQTTGKCEIPNLCLKNKTPCGEGTYCDTKTGKCVDTKNTGDWLGWASTSQFGAGDGPWGNVPSISNDKTNNFQQNMMGAAVPWRILCKQWGTKNKQINSTIDSALGKNDEKSCWLIQPINEYPNNLSGSIDPNFNTEFMNNTCPSGESCKNINGNDIVASYTDENGNKIKYPEYLITPFEGCGGDCKDPADCMNGCAGGVTTTNDAKNAVECDFKNITTDKGTCDAMRILQGDDSKWEWNEQVSDNFLKYSRPYTITKDSEWGSKMEDIKTDEGGHLNWCSGQNMHFDIALTDPYWMNLGGGGKKNENNIAETNAPSNIIVRYKKVPCNIYGNFDPNPPIKPGVYKSCIEQNKNWTDCSDIECSNSNCKDIIKPGDPRWEGSLFQNHSCCADSGGDTGTKKVGDDCDWDINKCEDGLVCSWLSEERPQVCKYKNY